MANVSLTIIQGRRATLFVKLSFICILLTGCAAQTQLRLPEVAQDKASAGTAISITRIAVYSQSTAKLMVWWAGMSVKLPVTYGVELYRVNYLTTGENGGLVKVSGLISLPIDATAKSVISWQHGTSLKRVDAPSTPTPDEGVLAAIAFAGDGSILVAPDYIGFGVSTLPHPYYHLATTVGSTRDLLLATTAIFEASSIKLPQRLFLAGFSQGGYATMATAQSLEQAPLPELRLIAAASVAGPIDLAGFTFNNSLVGEAESASMYLAYIFNSYGRIYGHDLADIFINPYAQLIPHLFNGENSGEQIAQHLPRQPRAMFKPDFLQRYNQGEYGWAGQHLSQNGLSKWRPATPLRLYYGTADKDVSPQEAMSQATKWQQQGLPVTEVSVGDYDHNQSVLEAAPQLRSWFSGF